MGHKTWGLGLLMASLSLSAPGWSQNKAPWPDQYPAPATLTEAYKEDGSQQGHYRLTFQLKKSALKPTWDAWLDGFKGWKVEDADTETPNAHSATLIQPSSGQRLHLTLSVVSWEPSSLNGRMEVLPKARPASAFKPPGKCKPIPDRGYSWIMSGFGINQSGEGFNVRSNILHETHTTIDLDGDGVQDKMVPVVKLRGKGRTHCPGDTRWELWVMRGECGHKVGTVVGEHLVWETWKAPFGPGGLKDLTTTTRSEPKRTGPIPVVYTDERTYRYKNGAYREINHERSGGKCHHCPSLSCIGPEKER